MNPLRKRVSSASYISLITVCPRAPLVFLASWLPGPRGSGIGMDGDAATHGLCTERDVRAANAHGTCDAYPLRVTSTPERDARATNAHGTSMPKG